MANALSQVRSALQPKAGNPSPASAVLRIVAVDGTSLLHAVRMAVDSVRALKLPVTRMGPFDDSRIAETGFFVAGPPSALAKLKKVVEERAAKAGIPILVSEHKVKNEPGSVAEQADSETGQMVEGGPGSGHFGHKGRHGLRGGSSPGSAGLTLDPVQRGFRRHTALTAQSGSGRSLTDAQIGHRLEALAIKQHVSSYGSDAEGKSHSDIFFSGMNVSDRLRAMELNAPYKDLPYTARKDWKPPYDFKESSLSAKVRDQLPKDATPEQVLQKMKEAGLVLPAGSQGGNYYNRPQPHFSMDQALHGLTPKQKDEYVDKLPGTIKRMDEANKHLGWITPTEELSVKQNERLADHFDKIAGKFQGMKLSPDDSLSYADKNEIQVIRKNFGQFSQTYEVARYDILDGWAARGGTPASLVIKDVVARAFPQNDGIKFFSISGETVPRYSDRLIGHVQRMKKETENFYAEKLKTKKDPTPDLAQHQLAIMRAVGGNVSAYTPSAAESWTTDKGTIPRFGKMMIQPAPGGYSYSRKKMRGWYTALQTTVSYKDVLWSYQSAAKWMGWPPEKNLKGKKEFVLLGSSVRNVQAEVRIEDY